jgi:hypothetical protein
MQLYGFRATHLLVCFSFSLLFSLDFLHCFVENLTSGVCKHSWLCQFPSRGSSDFRVFVELFLWDFRAQLVPSIMRHLCSDFFVGIMDRCLVHLCA